MTQSLSSATAHKHFTTDESRWRAVLARDASANGSFVFGVNSTGIYCRPTCPARRPRPENVSFYGTPAEAERSGLRACMRCKPNDPSAGNEVVVEKLCRYLEQHADGRVTLESLGRVARMSPFHVQKIFKRALGVSPRQYLEAHRFKALKASLTQSSVTDATYEAGFSSPSQVYGTARKRLGMSPRQYATGARGEQLRYTVTATRLGNVLLAASSVGLCEVQFVDSENPEQVLRAQYPLATFERDDRALAEYATAVRKAAEGGAYAALPLDIRGTAFQQRVWRHLQTIPRGETRSYAELAEEIGSPAAIRAVASACASNHLAMVVPCHRVVHKSDKAAAQYRWGAARKAKLLEAEQAR